MITPQMEWKLIELRNRMIFVGNNLHEIYEWHGYDYHTIQCWIDQAHAQNPFTDWNRILNTANDIWKNLPE